MAVFNFSRCCTSAAYSSGYSPRSSAVLAPREPELVVLHEDQQVADRGPAVAVELAHDELHLVALEGLPAVFLNSVRRFFASR